MDTALSTIAREAAGPRCHASHSSTTRPLTPLPAACRSGTTPYDTPWGVTRDTSHHGSKGHDARGAYDSRNLTRLQVFNVDCDNSPHPQHPSWLW